LKKSPGRSLIGTTAVSSDFFNKCRHPDAIRRKWWSEEKPTRDGRGTSPGCPSRKVGGLGDPALPNIVSAAFLPPQDV